MKILGIKEKLSRGFTMIELLIVIAVLGILAVAVLATINPIEQINRGRDTGSRGDAEQLLSAIDRYNATQGLWPWQEDTDSPDAVAWGPAEDVEDPAQCPLLDKIAQGGGIAACGSGADEVKAAFTTRLRASNYNALYMEFSGSSGDSLYICFSPQSGAFKTEAERRCDVEGVPADFPAAACGACDALAGALGDSENCICLP